MVLLLKEQLFRGTDDLDLFIRFNRDIPEEKFSDIIAKIHKELGNVPEIINDKIVHGTYEYIECSFEGVMVNIVPCYYCEEYFRY